jgi:hypothetical protein
MDEARLITLPRRSVRNAATKALSLSTSVTEKHGPHDPVAPDQAALMAASAPSGGSGSAAFAAAPGEGS